MKKILIPLISIFLAISSCQTKQNHKQDTVNLKGINTIDVLEKDILHNDTKLSTVLKLDSLVFLETTEASLIGKVSKVEVTNDYIYVLDKSVSQKLYCFNRNGKLKNVFGAIGRGPSEYMRIQDFTVIDTAVYIITYPKNKLFKLKKDLSSFNVLETPFNESSCYIRKLCTLGKNTLIFFDQNSDYMFGIYNTKENKIEKRFSKKLGQDGTFANKTFQYNQQNNLLVTKHYRDTIYQLQNNKLLPYLKVNFENGIPWEQMKEIIPKNWMKRRFPQGKMYTLDDFYESKDYITFSFWYKSEGKNNILHYFFKNKKTSETKIVSRIIENKLLGFNIPYCMGFEQNSLIFSVEPYKLLENRDIIAADIPDDLNENSNPVLVFLEPNF